jgi:hypothetical protein
MTARVETSTYDEVVADLLELGGAKPMEKRASSPLDAFDLDGNLEFAALLKSAADELVVESPVVHEKVSRDVADVEKVAEDEILKIARAAVLRQTLVEMAGALSGEESGLDKRASVLGHGLIEGHKPEEIVSFVAGIDKEAAPTPTPTPAPAPAAPTSSAGASLGAGVRSGLSTVGELLNPVTAAESYGLVGGPGQGVRSDNIYTAYAAPFQAAGQVGAAGLTAAGGVALPAAMAYGAWNRGFRDLPSGPTPLTGLRRLLYQTPGERLARSQGTRARMEAKAVGLAGKESRRLEGLRNIELGRGAAANRVATERMIDGVMREAGIGRAEATRLVTAQSARANRATGARALQTLGLSERAIPVGLGGFQGAIPTRSLRTAGKVGLGVGAGALIGKKLFGKDEDDDRRPRIVL